MTGKVHLILGDPHAHPDHHNERATWLSKLIMDIKPDVVVNIGDSADMPSLSSYDKGKRSFHGRTYAADIASHLDFQERLFGPIKRTKKRLPKRVVFIGNHDQRIEKALDLSPELEGTISTGDLCLSDWYSEVVPYVAGAPGVATLDGISYAHFHSSGVMGRAVGGQHPATSLITTKLTSCVSGHLHLADWSVRTDGTGRKVHGLFTGVYQDYVSDWAGEANKLWWRGIVVLRNVEDGNFDPQFISLDSIKREYG